MTILPDLTEKQLSDLSSQGEAKVYRSLRDHLPDDYLVLFQVGWILRREKDRARDGETDFLICHPTRGYLCVEVKGGGIGFLKLPSSSCGASTASIGSSAMNCSTWA